jgi:LuxR family maltose regulon positive regulatory protein
VFRRVPSVVSPKLQVPLLPPDFVVRHRLHERLNVGIGRKLTLLRAPAGFGKTTLVAGWLRDDDRPRAWLSLDDHDSDLRVFLRSFVDAVQTVLPGAGRRALALVTQAERIGLSYLSVVLADDLAQIPDDLVIVLDDYHVIRDQSVHVLLSTLLRRLPPNVQLVIASRDDPPLPTAALRARRELAEIDVNDLRFDIDEARAFLERAGGQPLHEPGLADTLRRCEGWAVGLRLTTLAGSSATMPFAGAWPSVGGGQFVDEYFLGEVLQRRPETIQQFLLQTSVLDRLCASLCESLVEGLSLGDGRRLLDQIQHDGLFLTSLDGQQRWYRYHPLFREALQRRLELDAGPERVQALHARASVWLAEEGLVDEAIQHALAADDLERAVGLVESSLAMWMEREDWVAIDTWLRRLPHDLVQARPFLALGRCRVLIIGGQFGELGAQLHRLDALLAQEPPPLDEPALTTVRGQVNAQLSYVVALRGHQDQQAHERATLALQQLPPDQVDMRATAGMMYAITSQMLGRGDEALDWLRDQLDCASESHPAYLGRLLLAQAYVELATGRLTRLGHTSRQYLALGTAHGLATDVAWARYFLGRVAYEWNDVEAAREHFAAGLSLRDRANFLCVWNTTLGLAQTLVASGRADEARRLTRHALEIAEQTHRTIVVESLRSFEARLALATGDHAAAAEGIDTVSAMPRPVHAFDVEQPLLTRVRILLAHDTDATLCQALATVDQALALAEARHTVPQIVEALALKALVQRALGDSAESLRTLARALELAEPGRLTRVFVDLGPPLAGLLVELTGDGATRDNARRVLAACRAEAGLPGPALPSRVVAPAGDIEPLTWRELEILHLLDARYSNKEIARTLCISWETVKKHAANIYGKLQVSGRRDAVARARALGLIREESRPPAPSV